MKQIISIITLTIIASLTVSAEELTVRNPAQPSGLIAKSLIQKFDRDASHALNELELSAAVEYLENALPFLNDSLDYTASVGEISASPKVAVELIDGFDGDNDVQLTREELSLAITYLRRLNRDARGVIALAE